ncbi:MAG: hypothetical protein AAGA58_02975 [Verrucomicrobiota bacterium]
MKRAAIVAALLIVGIPIGFLIFKNTSIKNWKRNASNEIARQLKLHSEPPGLDEHEWMTGYGHDTVGNWMSTQWITCKDGSWLAYRNECTKEGRWWLGDLFIARDSEGIWYQSDYHFCVDAFVLRMRGQPESLGEFIKNYDAVRIESEP